MNSSEFDRRFEDGESMIDTLDLSAARRPTAGSEARQRRLSALDGRATRPGGVPAGGDTPVDHQGLAGGTP